MLGRVATIIGSVAGIQAVLYAFGFVATQVEFRVLGIGAEFASNDPVAHVGRGGGLIISTLLVAGPVVVLLVGLAALFRFQIRRTDWWQARSGNRLGRIADAVWAPLASIAMLGIAIWAMYLFVRPLSEVEGMLFGVANGGTCEGLSPLAKAILQQDRPMLTAAYALFALMLGGIIGLGVVGRRRLLAEPTGLWLGLAITAAALAVIVLPVVYGTLAVKIEKLPVAITPSIEHHQNEPMRLLSRTESGVLVWLEESRQVRWISAGLIDVVTASRREPVIVADCANPEPEGEGE